MEMIFGLGSIDSKYGVVDGPIERLMPFFFADKFYGVGCNLIGYRVLCLEDDGKPEIPPIKYIVKSKKIECYIDLDYKTVHSISKKKEYMRYVKNVFLNEAQSFEDLNILNFDLKAYIKDLEAFFDDYNSRFNDSDEIQELNYV
ncbi:MAG: hypothetical protein ACTHJ0_16335 [Flavipsychrobacter sp.]